MKRKINKYVNLIDKQETLPHPDNGDCWFCLLQDSNKKSLGDITSDIDHLLSHIDEAYLHGSILVNSMREKGYSNQQIGFHYQLNLRDTFKRALRQYLQRRLLK